MTCPIVREIAAIRGAGIFDDTAEVPLVKLGGTDDGPEFVCDDMSFYIMMRRMEFARLEMTGAPISAYERMLRGVAGLTYAEIYRKLVDAATKRMLVYQQFVNLINLVDKLEQVILARVDAAARLGQSINISLPDMIFLPDTDMAIMYNVDALTAAMNTVIDYVNKINVNSLAGVGRTDRILGLEKFGGHLDMKTRVPALGRTVEAMREILDHELRVAMHLREVERYQCHVINHMNPVYDVCKKIIDTVCIAR